MNCKPGDLAIIICGGPYAGMIVRTVHSIPSGSDFLLPDGFVHLAIDWCDGWVIEFMRDIDAPCGEGVKIKTHTRKTRFAALPDRVLRPISGIPDTEQTDEREPIKDVA